MKRSLALLLAAADAVLAALLGLALPLVAAATVWAARGLPAGGGDLTLRFAADTWLLSLGGALSVTLDEATAVGLGASGPVAFTLAIAPMGLTLLTVVVAARGARRAAAAGIARDGVIVSTILFAVIAGVVSAMAAMPAVTPILWRSVLGAALVYGIPATIAAVRPHLAEFGDEHPLLALSTRLVKGMAAGLLASSALVLGAGLIAGMGRVLSVFQSMHLDPMGAVVAGFSQLAMLPNFLVWALAWSTGPGVEIGQGASATMLGTNLGPLPLVPLFGVIPEGTAPWLLAAAVVPFLGTTLGSHSIRFGEDSFAPSGMRAGAAAIASLVLAIVAGLLVLLAAGPVGPERLAWIGPNPLWTMLAVFGFALVGGLVGAFLPRGFLLGEVHDDQDDDDVAPQRTVREAQDEEADDVDDEGDEDAAEEQPRRHSWFGRRRRADDASNDTASDDDPDEDELDDEDVAEDEIDPEQEAWGAWVAEAEAEEAARERANEAEPEDVDETPDTSIRHRFTRRRDESAGRTAGGLKRAIQRDDEPDIYADIDLDD
ncbi:cell division protein PerM [Pseudoclavibacter albus]|uniref:cell division protein PerM n=1 Tax=Pseudoclavibacter albus TaxID=272241 RepID=UPI000825CE72|nr:DUF6350 family protein [Pseudoclavibacter alba]